MNCRLDTLLGKISRNAWNTLAYLAKNSNLVEFRIVKWPTSSIDPKL